MYFICICNICNFLRHVLKCIIYGIQPFHGYFTYQRHKIKNSTGFNFVALLKQKSSISTKGSRHFVNWLLSGLDVLSSSNRNESSSESKARIFFIVIPIDLTMSVCRYTNISYFSTALMPSLFLVAVLGL